MEARLRTLACLRIVQGLESRPSFSEPLDAGERRDLRDFDNRRDLAAGEIWSCVEREQQTHLEAIRDDPEAMWRKLESVHMQKRPGTRFNTYNALLSLSKSGSLRSKTSLVRPRPLLPFPTPPLRSPARSVVAPVTPRTSASLVAMPAPGQRRRLLSARSTNAPRRESARKPHPRPPRTRTPPRSLLVRPL